MSRHRQKHPSRTHLLRALRCTCSADRAQDGCSNIGCEKCRAWSGADIPGEHRATCWRDPRLTRVFLASGETP